MDKERSQETDIENAIIMYKNLINLNDTQACDERLWVGLAHSTFYEYMNYRWKDQNTTLSATKSRYFFGQSKRRSLITNTMSRIWWTGRYIYDESYENPFELAEYFKSDYSTKILYIFSSNVSSNDKVRKALLIAVNNYEKKGITIDRLKLKEIIKYLNILGGTYLLDYFTKQELVDKIEKYVEVLLRKSS